MPKIPTFEAKGRITAEAAGIRTGLQVSPTATPAGALSKVAKVAEDYYIKKRDTAEKVESAKKVFEIKGELDKYLEAEKENINDEDAINNFKSKYNDYVNQQLGQVKNRRVKTRIQQNLDLELSEYVYNIKKNSYKALETESLKNINNDINSLSGKYATSDNSILKVKYKTQAKDKMREFADDFDLPKNVLDKKLEAIDRDFLLADMQQFAGKSNGAEQIVKLDESLGGTKFLTDQDFGKGIFAAYNNKISELTVKGDPNSDYDRALELVDELKEFKRSNGYAIKTEAVSVQIDNLEQKILNEKISHDKIIKGQGDNKVFYSYANDLKNDLSKSIADPFGQPELADRIAATEIEQEFDKRIKNYVATYPDATLAEKQAFARSTTYILKNKYEDNKIEKVSNFNLQSDRSDFISTFNTVSSDMQLYREGKLDQDKIDEYKSLAKNNGFQTIESFMNEYLPLLKSQIPEGS